MSAATEPLAGIPYPSFAGISFPKAKKVITVGDGDVIELGGRNLTVISMPDHAAGSLLFLDRRERILFSGDEVQDVKRVNGSVRIVRDQLRRLMQFRPDFDRICAGPGIFSADLVEKLLACAEEVLAGAAGEPVPAGQYEAPAVPGFEGRIIYRRHGSRREDMPEGFDRKDPDKRIIRRGNAALLYDIRKIF